MDAYDFLNFATWLKDNNRKPANVAFTAGAVRDAAYAVEQSGVLEKLATLEAEREVLESMLKADKHLEFHVGADAYGGYYASPRCTLDGKPRGFVGRGPTITVALAALVAAAEEGKQ